MPSIQNIFIWKDMNDTSTFLLGYKNTEGNFNAWLSIHSDGLWDLFGQKIATWAQGLPKGEPKAIELSLTEK